MSTEKRLHVPEKYLEANAGFFEPLPYGVIEGVDINTRMRTNISDPRLGKWFDADFLIERAGIFALGGIQGEPRLQTPTSHRGVILMKDAFFRDEYGTGFGEIGVKGTGLTHNGIDHYEKNNAGSDPLGFFGYRHAIQEMKLSDEFAEFGGRGGRVIGVIALNPDALKNWAMRQSPNWDTYYQVG